MKIKELVTDRLIMRAPVMEDAGLLKNFEDRNRDHLGIWETLPNDPIDKRLLGLLKDIEDNRSVRFLMFLKERPEGPVIGMCNFTQIFRGFFQACFLGYKIDREYEGKGLMKEALEAGTQYMFEEVKLHRIMANYVPRNERSGNLLKKLGFVIEGHAQEYLLINGVWEDHVLTSLTNHNWR